MARNRIKRPFYKQAFPMIIFILLIIYVISFLLPFLWGIFASMNSVQMFSENIDIYNGNSVSYTHLTLPTTERV